MIDFLNVNNITVDYFGGYIGCKDISFSLKENQMFLLYGKQGSGKTSLLKAIAGLEKYSGEITLNDKNLKDISLMERNFVINLDEKSLDLNKTVYDNLVKSFVLRNEKVNESVLNYYLERYGLKKYLYENVKRLNNELISIILLVRVLLRNADLYLLDNPLEKIDNKLRYDIFNLLVEDLKNKTVIYACDNLDEILSFNEKFAIISYTMFVQYGFIEDMKTRPNTCEVVRAWNKLEENCITICNLVKKDNEYYLEYNSELIKTNEPISKIYSGKKVKVIIDKEKIRNDVYFDEETEYIISKRGSNG